MRKLFLLISLLLTGLSNAQQRSYPVFPDDGSWPEKGSIVTIIIVSVFVLFILALVVIIIRKSSERGRKTIIDGFTGRMRGDVYIDHSLFNDSSEKYSRRRNKRGGRDTRSGTGSTGIGGFGGGS